MTTVTRRIPDSSVPELHTKLTKLAARATKLGVPAPVWTVGTEQHPVYKDLPNGEKRLLYVEYDVTLTYEQVKLAGWSFLGTIDHLTEGGNLVRAVPGVDGLAQVYGDAEPTCDHCHTKRRRTETFVVQHEDGSRKRVGRNCVHDFLGADPERVLNSLHVVLSIGEALDEFGGFGGRSTVVARLDGWLPLVASAIRRHGWVSRTQAKEAYDGTQSTADRVNSIVALAEDYATKSGREAREWLAEVSDADRAEGAASLEWARTGLQDEAAAKPENDYLYNLAVVSRLEFFHVQHLGLVSSIVSAYQRHIGRERERKALAAAAQNSQYVGEVRQRLVLDLTVIKTHTFETQYGVTTLVSFADASGNRLKWFATGGASEWISTINPDKVYHVKATVKSHGEYKGLKETLLQRVAEEPTADEKKAAAAARRAEKKAEAAQKAAEDAALLADLPGFELTSEYHYYCRVVIGPDGARYGYEKGRRLEQLSHFVNSSVEVTY